MERAKGWLETVEQAKDADLQRERNAQAHVRNMCADWKQQPFFRILRRVKLLRDLTFD